MTTKYYLGSDGQYYGGDRKGEDQEVPVRPTQFHTWGGADWVFNPVPARIDAYAQIDAAAEAARLRYITGGAGQAATYLLKEQQARAYAAVSYTGTVPGLVQSEATARSITAQAACIAIIGEADGWHALAAVIETARRGGKVAVAAASTQAAIELARDTALAALEVV